MRYKFSGTFRDGSGHVVSGGTVSVYASGTTTAASIYETETGTTVVNSTTTGSDGTFTFYILEGDYYGDHTRKIVLSKAGYTSKTYDYCEPTEFVNGSFTQATIEAALTAIGTANKATLLLRPGTWVISSNADWSAYTNVTFKIVSGAKLSGAFTVNIPNVQAGLYQIFDSTLGVVTLSGNTKDVYPEWFDDVQKAINSAPQYGTVHINSAYTTTTGYTITSKNNLRITGNGSLALSGAATDAFLLKKVGTISGLEIDSLTLSGDNNAAYNQVGIGCASGQTISNVDFHDLKISNINIGITLNANLSGTYTKGVVRNNILTDIPGINSGQGYGIHLAEASQITVTGNIIDNASRHAIYQAKGENLGNVISGNTIKNHRSDVTNGTYRPAVNISRSSGVTVSNNIFEGGYDCSLGIQAETDSSITVSNILVFGNQFNNRKNVTSDIVIGEQLAPTVERTTGVTIMGNTFSSDVTGFGGASIYILNGNRINILNNYFHQNRTDNYMSHVAVGSPTYTTADADISNIVITGNIVNSVTYNASNRFVTIVDLLCTGASPYTIKDNILTNTPVYLNFATTFANANGVVDAFTTVTWDPAELLDGAGATSANIALVGAKLGDYISVAAPYDLQGIIATAYVKSTNLVSIRIQNETVGTIDLASGVWKVKIRP